MSADFDNSRIRDILGSIDAAVGPGGFLYAKTDGEGLSSLFEKWTWIEEDKRPYLRGLVTGKGESSRVLLCILLDCGNGLPQISVEADFPRDRPAPDFRQLWPHAAGWQIELQQIYSVRFSNEPSLNEVVWQRS